MRKLVVIIFAGLYSGSILSQTHPVADTSLLIGGLREECDEKINMYLAPAAATARKSIDLSKIHSWDLTKEFLKPEWAALMQGNQGSCTSFAVSFAISIQRNIDNWLFRKNRSLIQYSPSFVFNVAKAKYRDPFRSQCGEGISYIDAYLVVKENGIPTIQKCPYQTTSDGCQTSNYPSKIAFSEARNMRIGNFQRPFLKVDVFKALLVDTPFNPVCIAVHLSAEYDKASIGNGKWITQGEGNGQRLHAMLIVGFNDKLHAFKVLDWRGQSFGDNGVIWMDYNLIENKDVVFDAYIVSHGTEYLDPKTGSVTAHSSDTDQVSNKKFSFWIKAGHFVEKGKLRLDCNYVSKNTKRVTFRISDLATGELVKDDLVISEGQSKCIRFKDYYYKIKLVEIAKRGNKFNILHPYAAVIHLENSTPLECE